MSLKLTRAPKNDWRILDPKLIELWADFTIPVRVIGEMIGATKNACVGRAHRLGLPKRPTGFQIATGPRKPKHRKPSENIAQKSVQKDPVPKPIVVSQPVLAVKPRRDPRRNALGHFISTKPKPPPMVLLEPGTYTILDLTPHTCRWPMGKTMDRPPFLYCGEEPMENLPYCPQHANLAFTGTRAIKHLSEVGTMPGPRRKF